MRILMTVLLLSLSNLAAAESVPSTPLSPSVITPTPLLACWDQTFAYNAFAIEETDKYYYISFVGSTLTGLHSGDEQASFTLYGSGETYTISGWADGRDTVTAAYKKEACSWDAENENINCIAGDPSGRNPAESLYVERTLDNLGVPQVLVSKFHAQQVKVDGGKSGLVLQKIFNYDHVDHIESLKVEKSGSAGVDLDLSCQLDPGNGFLRVKAPLALVRYLEEQR